jgi:hypothetical protein
MSSLDGISQATSLRELHLTGNDLKGTSELRNVAIITLTSGTSGDNLAYPHPKLFSLILSSQASFLKNYTDYPTL